MARSQINHKAVAKKVTEGTDVSAYDLNEMIETIERGIKNQIRSREPAIFLIAGFFRLQPHHGMIVKSLAFRYISYVKMLIEGIRNTNIPPRVRERAFRDIKAYIQTYSHFRDYKRRDKKKKYYFDYYKKFQ